MYRSIPAVLCALLLLTGCASSPQHEGGWFVLRWIERPAANGPSKHATTADHTHFDKIASYEHDDGKAAFDRVVAGLREGDVIAYRMGMLESGKEILTGHLAKVGYSMLKYGHLAVLTEEGTPNKLRLFSSESFKGPNTAEGIDTLAGHSFDVYRLDKWDRVDVKRFHEFVRLAKAKAGKWYGYDFSGMFGLWNSNMEPRKPQEIGHDYICSTVVVTAYYYAGVELDAVQRGGIADIVTPLQVVSSDGRMVGAPQGELVAEAGQAGDGR